MRERRKEYRIPEENKVVLSFPTVDGVPGPHFVALTRDISPSGVSLIAGIPASVDTNLRLEIGLAGSCRLFRGRGTVRWVNRLFEDTVFEMGLEFTGIHPESVGAILEHVYGRPHRVSADPGAGKEKA
jgi:hypothetical protein